MNLAKFIVIIPFILSLPVRSQKEPGFDFLRDRGGGIPSSLFGTYLEKKDLVVYPFVEYYSERNEYNPKDLGFDLDETHILFLASNRLKGILPIMPGTLNQIA